MSIIRPSRMEQVRLTLNDDGIFRIVVALTPYADGHVELQGFFLECLPANTGFAFKSFNNLLYEWFAGRLAVVDDGLEEWLRVVMLRGKYMGAAPGGN